MISIENGVEIPYIRAVTAGIARAEDETPARTSEPIKTITPPRARQLVLKALIRLGVYPQIYFSFMPFKIFEFQELTRNLQLRAADRLLDLGCGAGLQTLLLAKKCQAAVGVDIDRAAILSARRKAELLKGQPNVQFLAAPLEQANLASGSFDKVISFCVLEHISNYEEVLSEIHRLLKSGGELILSADSLAGIEDPEILDRHRRACHVVRYFQREELLQFLGEAGFRRIVVYPIFCSEYARKLFLRGLRLSFRFGKLSSLLSYFLLRFHEKRSRSDQGLFLVARCTK